MASLAAVGSIPAVAVWPRSAVAKSGEIGAFAPRDPG